MVVGGAGFVGSHLTDRLLAEGHTVDVVDDLTSGSLGNLSEARAVGGDLSIHTLSASAPQFPALVERRHPDVIYLMCALVPGRPAESTGGASLGVVMTVLEAARALGGVKVVCPLSAVSLYGEVAARDLPVKEGHVWNPVGVRGAVTRSVSELLSAYREVHEVEYTALAMANVYGPRQRPDGGVVAAFADAFTARRAPVVHGDGKQTRDFLYIDDAVDALVRAAHRGGGLVVNVGTGVATSILDLWDLLGGPSGRPAELGPRRAGDVPRFALAPTRARIHLAWAPWTDLSTGLRGLRTA